jgi:hypothetical protein
LNETYLELTSAIFGIVFGWINVCASIMQGKSPAHDAMIPPVLNFFALRAVIFKQDATRDGAVPQSPGSARLW